MGLTLIEAATGCVKEPESRLEHLAVIKTFARGELLSWLPFMNIVGGASDEGHAAARALLQPGAGHPSRSREAPAGIGIRRPGAGAAPILPLGRSDPNSCRLARAKKRAPAAELLWLPGRPLAAWCCLSGAGWRWLASQEGEKTPPRAH